MFQSIKYEDKREVFGFKIHRFSTLDRIKKYDDSDNEENAEKPYSRVILGAEIFAVRHSGTEWLAAF